VPQRSDAKRQRVAIVFDGAVEEPAERRRFLVGKIQGHVIDRSFSLPSIPLPSLRRSSAIACSPQHRVRRSQGGPHDPWRSQDTRTRVEGQG